MKISLNYKKETDKRLKFLLELLPIDIKDYLYSYIEKSPEILIDEIRMHRNSKIVLISRLSSIVTDMTVDKDHIESTLLSFCKGSVYSYFNTINEGYINVGQGIRAGVCGRATVQNGSISGISDITSINIRLPKRIYHAGDYIYELIKGEDFKASVILYSSPGVGKTTILRELIERVSSNDRHLRLSVIDTREELISGMNNESFSDSFLSYPKGTAISIATRTMSPELIICDEISTKEEADAVLQAVNCGVTFIASTHASCFEELINKINISALIEKNVFKYAVGVKRDRGSTSYVYELNSLL